MVLALLLACVHAAPPALEAPPAPPPTPGPVRIEQPLLAGAILFPDELRPTAEAAAAFLEAQGWQVLPLDEQQRLITIAAEGRRASDGAQCSVPYVGAHLLDHSYPDHAEAELRADCVEDCTVSLTISAPPSAEKPGVEWIRWEAKAPAPPTVAGVIEAIPAFEVSTQLYGYGGIMGGLGGRFDGRGVYARFVEQYGPWGELDPWKALQSVDLDACWTDWRRDFWSNPVLVELSAEGRVTRCEAAYPFRLPESGFDCVCEVLAGASFPPGEPGRRVRFEADPFQPTPTTREGRHIGVNAYEVSSETVGYTWAATGLPEHRMASCLTTASGAEPFAGAIVYQLDAGGVPVSWQVDWPAWVDADAQACLEPLLAQARFGCSQSGEPGEARVKLSISVRD